MKKLVLVLILGVFSLNTPAQSPKPSTLKAADELMQVMNMEAQFNLMMTSMLDAQMAQNPQMAQYRDIFEDFFSKYFNYSVLKDQMIGMYAELFTEKEIKELIAFYQTPTGQKTIIAMPKMMQQSMELGQKNVQEHLPELQQKIMERMQQQD